MSCSSWGRDLSEMMSRTTQPPVLEASTRHRERCDLLGLDLAGQRFGGLLDAVLGLPLELGPQGGELGRGEGGLGLEEVLSQGAQLRHLSVRFSKTTPRMAWLRSS